MFPTACRACRWCGCFDAARDRRRPQALADQPGQRRAGRTSPHQRPLRTATPSRATPPDRGRTLASTIDFGSSNRHHQHCRSGHDGMMRRIVRVPTSLTPRHHPMTKPASTGMAAPVMKRPDSSHRYTMASLMPMVPQCRRGADSASCHRTGDGVAAYSAYCSLTTMGVLTARLRNTA